MIAAHREGVSERQIKKELLKCAFSKAYFIDTYCQIFDPVSNNWIPFRLWPAQRRVLRIYQQYQKVVVLKARQNGLSWLALADGLHDMLFKPIAEVLIFSRHEREAAKLLSDERLKGMYHRLPVWMKAAEVVVDKYTEFRLSNGSGATAFPSTAGDSYTATKAIVDEADLVENLKKLLGRVEPTVEAGGRLLLISKSNKDLPASHFKAIYKGAKEGKNAYYPVFLGWYEHPARDQAWYDALCAHHLTTDGSLDEVHENYPATDAEALAPRTLDKRIPARHLQRCLDDLPPLYAVGDTDEPGLPPVPGLKIYEMPRPGRHYVVGIDAAEGKETSNDTALTVLEVETLIEVAHLSGRIEPTMTAVYAHEIGSFYNDAAIMPERNNHGHVIIAWLEEHSPLAVLAGLDERPGWNSNTVGKFVLYNTAADTFRDAQATVRTFKTYTQLTSIQRSTLKAPPGEADDCADSFVLALAGALHGLVTASGWGGVWSPD